MAALEPAAGPELLVAEPLVRTEIKNGYARVSTGGQKLERPIDALTAAGCRKIFADKKSGKNALRPELKACHAFLDAGDTLVVPSLDRYGRSLQDLINMVAELRERRIGFTLLHEDLDTTTPGGRLVFHVFAALAEFVRELIVIGTNEGLAAARDLLPDPGRSITSIAKLLGVSPGTLYNHIPDLRELRAGAVPAARSLREVTQRQQDQSQRHFLYRNYSHPALRPAATGPVPAPLPDHFHQLREPLHPQARERLHPHRLSPQQPPPYRQNAQHRAFCNTL